MAVEIERKFLVKDLSCIRDVLGTRFRQGYLCSGQGVTVRVRSGGGRAFLTVKGPATGFSRAEFEYEIPVKDAEEILNGLCRRPIIEKTRYVIPQDDVKWEVDVFEADNAGLVVAEVEVPSEAHHVNLPAWLGAEVTTDRRYSNVALVECPYSKWPDR
jgi:adenylate cyclase